MHDATKSDGSFCPSFSELLFAYDEGLLHGEEHPGLSVERVEGRLEGAMRCLNLLSEAFPERQLAAAPHIPSSNSAESLDQWVMAGLRERFPTASELRVWLSEHDLIEPSQLDEVLDTVKVSEDTDPVVLLRHLLEEEQLRGRDLGSLVLAELFQLAAGNPSAGLMLGNYQLEEEVGRGGMGIVYRARQLAPIRRTVALKLVSAGLVADEQQVSRFYAEAEAAASLHHPGIVPIYEVGCHAGHHFYSMAYIEGVSLAERIKAAEIPGHQAAQILREIAQAVSHAHAQGLIHRDLKPGNILLDAKSHAHITDFGLAKRLDEASDLTREGQVLGTPQYMSPEQAGGNRTAVGPRSDVYSMGAILYAVLTGQPPFESASVRETLQQVQTAAPTPPRALNSQVPADLETICLKCLEKLPEQRYATARALADDLQRYLNGQPILARPVSRLEHAWRWCRRNRGLATLSAALACAVTLVAVFSSTLAITTSRANLALAEKTTALSEANHKLHRAVAESDEQRDAAERATASAESRLYAGQIALAQHSYEEESLALARQQLEICRPEQRGWEYRYLAAMTYQSVPLYTNHRISGASFSADGQLLACRTNHTLRVLDVATQQELWQVPYAEGAFRFSGDFLVGYDALKITLWDATSGAVARTFRFKSQRVVVSPDGRFLAALSKQKLAAWNLETGGEVFMSSVDLPDTPVRLLYEPSQSRLFTTLYNGAVMSWNALDGTDEQVVIPGKQLDGPGIILPSGMSADCMTFVVQHEQQCEVWDVSKRRNVRNINLRGDSILALSADGLCLASHERRDDSIRLWNLHTSKPLRDISIQFHSIGKVMSPDCRWMAIFDGPAGLRVVNIKAYEDQIRLTDGGYHLTQAVCTRDGRHVVGTYTTRLRRRGPAVGGYTAFSKPSSEADDLSVRVWDTATGRRPESFDKHKVPVHCLAVAADSRTVASGDDDGIVKVWDLETGRESFELPPQTGPARSLAFSPDGKRLAVTCSGAGSRTCQSQPASGLLELVAHGVGSPSLTTLLVSSAVEGQDSHRKLPKGWYLDTEILIRVYDLESKAELFAIRGHGGVVHCVEFSPDGKSIATASADHTIKLWNAESGQEIATLMAHAGGVRTLAFRPDGLQLASAGEDSKIKLWDTETWLETHTLEGHVGTIHKIAYTPDGARIASGSEDTLIKLWDAHTGEEALTLKRHQVPVREIAFTDADRLTTIGSGKDQDDHIWYADLGR